MGGAMMKGWLSAGVATPDHLAVCVRDEDNVVAWRSQGVQVRPHWLSPPVFVAHTTSVTHAQNSDTRYALCCPSHPPRMAHSLETACGNAVSLATQVIACVPSQGVQCTLPA
jgi:hypothetical protein